MKYGKILNGFEGLYQISNFGKITSLNHNTKKIREIKTPIFNRGYKVVRLYKKGKVYVYGVHRLVAKAFIPNPENKPQVNHIDGNKENNRFNNLEWVTAKENTQHAISNHLFKNGNINKNQHLNMINIKKSNNKNSKKIKQYDLKGNFIKTWNSISEIEKSLKIYHSNISKCCKQKIKTTGGYIWRYDEKGD